MKTSKNRKDGGSYRRYETMVSLNCKNGKDRTKAKRKQKHKEKRKS